MTTKNWNQLNEELNHYCEKWFDGSAIRFETGMDKESTFWIIGRFMLAMARRISNLERKLPKETSDEIAAETKVSVIEDILDAGATLG